MKVSAMRPVAGVAILAAGALMVNEARAETRDYDLDAFEKVHIATGIQADITVGESQSVSIFSEKGDFEDLIVKVENGKLTVKREWKNSIWGGKRKPRYKVKATVTDLNAVKVSSGARVNATGMDGGDFELDTSSGSSASLKGDFDAIDIDASSGSSSKVEGACETVIVDISSGSSVRAKDLTCENAVADASSGASAILYATKSVTADASSGASVTVYGGASQRDVSKSSGGSVKVKE